MLTPRGRHLADDSGQITILLVMFSVIAMGFVMVAIDASLVFLGRQRLASAVDGAALRAAQQFDEATYFQQGCVSSVPLSKTQIDRVLTAYEKDGIALAARQVEVGGGPGVRVTGTLAVDLPDVPMIGLDSYTVTYRTEARSRISGVTC